jgi:undecaprenyl-diphosphatase
MINFIQSLILGLVEGFTEFLPISSTAHLIIASNLMRLAQTDYTKTFAIAIQSGSILAVVVLYWKRFLDWQVLKRIIIAFIPTGLLGLVFYKLVKSYLLGNMGVVLWALGLGGIFLIIFEYIFKSKGSHASTELSTGAAALFSEGTSTLFSTGDDIKSINTGSLLGIGLFQAMAMIPGVSRAAATIIGGMI